MSVLCVRLPPVFLKGTRFLVVPWTFCYTVCMTVWQRDIETARGLYARQMMHRAQNSRRLRQNLGVAVGHGFLANIAPS